MIVVDTNVISQPLRPDGSPRVIDWIDAHAADLYLPTLVVSELLYGAHRLHDPVQRTNLLLRINPILARFVRRFLPFDLAAARLHGQLAGECERGGRILCAVDGRIAAIALLNNAPVATRDTRHFERTGVTLINPWHA